MRKKKHNIKRMPLNKRLSFSYAYIIGLDNDELKDHYFNLDHNSKLLDDEKIMLCFEKEFRKIK